MTYYVKRAWTGFILKLIRISGSRQEMWTTTGWIPDSDLEWTGIGGSADWDLIGEEEAAAAIEEMRREVRS